MFKPQLILDRILKGIILFLLPLTLLTYLFKKGIEVISKVVEPIKEHLPEQRIFGIGMVTLLSIFLLLLVCYVFGWLVEKSRTRFYLDKIDNLLASIIPGYSMMKTRATDVIGTEDKEWRVVLMGEEDDWKMGIEVGKQEGDYSLIFFPEPPDAKAGEIKLIHQSKIKYSDIPVNQLLMIIRKYGSGAAALLKNKS